ncbi:PepSY domain-containing protein [Streptomyces resistomycificus]|uniref:Peptidase propeptide and YpeB domain protein n=1 Tax=Streptomyces resistomycificus TaxID=67356 RepID=A0A0L8L850_9ACTN|nr:PepSY domain-containing protein [Streptomyces resistomycificus]KOG34383.1 peptidase propeptide and YpeB domain protein [Streptomyces resistomycificus]KUN98828.1 peptidase propeptide and YpeB domain protein [Streptomyces resistomycificus]
MKRNIVIAAVTAAALIGGGTASALAVSGDGDGTARQADVRAAGAGVRDDDARDTDDADDADDARDTDRADDARDDDSTRVSGDVTAAEAIAAALKHSPGTAVSVDLDDQDDAGPVVWDVDVLGSGSTWHSVRIDPATGKVLGSHSEQEDDTAQVRAALKGSSVTAREAAEAAAGKGTVTSVDLDEEGSSKAWEVETHKSGKAEQDWRVDLTSGKVTADRSDAGDDAADGDDD